MWRVEKKENVPLKIYDFKGDLIERFSRFLIIASKSQLKKTEKAWNQRFYSNSKLYCL